MKRREFMFNSSKGRIVAIIVMAILVGGVQIACNNTPTTPSDPVSKVFTSSNDQGHTHTITIQRTEIETPPAGGISRQTSANGHTHTFTMTQAEMTNVKNGTSVTVTTSDSNGHSHTFTIQKWY